MSVIDVLVMVPCRPEQFALLEQRYRLHRYDLADSAGKTHILEQFASSIRAVITTHTGGFPEALLDRLPNVEIVAVASVGFDTVCIDACEKRSVAVTNTPDVLTDDVADMALMLLLNTVRRLLNGVDWIRSGRWQRQEVMPLNTSLTGKRVGIVGLGRIGKAIAHRCEAFGLLVCYYGRREQEAVTYAWYSDLTEMAENVDVMMVVVPGGIQTQGLISKKVLKALGKDGYFINVSRGSVVDEDALIEALESGDIKGAGLDVFANEPYVPARLLALDNVVLQPHCASATEETRGAMSQLVVDNLAAHFAGQALLTKVY
ncbi:2-hydroxyacid dehydrogenase [Marinomonas sp. IMCC 4694]|uniref:2-hydroxyacid dehydrogenase n=1 Tax=Marinomonas sp. IMCC 4694 TaxID=2605432 RepID=UPI0011E6903D|nr:2-hydroxyacid dehydrogenase [Marinomonas sp. IMCC 4694]TYL48934.1 2-hydroxyacid dehydrogenase [Marinomonas sp. IMCC 4694]